MIRWLVILGLFTAAAYGIAWAKQPQDSAEYKFCVWATDGEAEQCRELVQAYKAVQASGE